jgi:putative glycosyltransferase (TIGR04372 family)
MAVALALILLWVLGSAGAVAVALSTARRLLREDDANFAIPLPQFGLKVARRSARRVLGRLRVLAPREPAAVQPTEPPAPATPVAAAHGPDAPAAGEVAEADFPTRIEALDREAHGLIYTTADRSEARAVLEHRRAIQDVFARQLGFDPSEVLLLNGDWLVAIGHLALLEFWVKYIRLGWGPWKRLVIVAYPGCVANEAYLEYWREWFTIVTDPDLCRALYPFARYAGHSASTLGSLPDGTRDLMVDLCGQIHAAWARDNRSPLLRLSETDAVRGRSRLREMGVPEGAWFVCIHSRASGYHEQRAYHQSHRDADIESYSAAIEEITARGGWVIRLGDTSMKAMVPRPQLIDYALGPHKADWMDVFLLASCRFYLGGTSGVSHVPATFGVSTALVNWIAPVLPFTGGRDRYIPKLLWNVRERRVLTFPEQFEPAARAASNARPFLDQIGLRDVDNTPEEIRDLAVEMLDVTGERPAGRAEDEELQAEFNAIVDRAGVSRTMRIGTAFLRTHIGLLTSAESPARRAG